MTLKLNIKGEGHPYLPVISGHSDRKWEAVDSYLPLVDQVNKMLSEA